MAYFPLKVKQIKLKQCNILQLFHVLFLNFYQNSLIFESLKI